MVPQKTKLHEKHSMNERLPVSWQNNQVPLFCKGYKTHHFTHMAFFCSSSSHNYLSLPHLSFSATRKKSEFTNYCDFFFHSSNWDFCQWYKYSALYNMSQLSNARLSFLQLFSIHMNKPSFVSTSYKVQREMESSSLFFSSELKSYSEFLILQEKYVCSPTTETIDLLQIPFYYYFLNAFHFFFLKHYSCHCSTVDGAVDHYCILVICVSYCIVFSAADI